jgi:hypothetical protein
MYKTDSTANATVHEDGGGIGKFDLRILLLQAEPRNKLFETWCAELELSTLLSSAATLLVARRSKLEWHCLINGSSTAPWVWLLVLSITFENLGHSPGMSMTRFFWLGQHLPDCHGSDLSSIINCVLRLAGELKLTSYSHAWPGTDAVCPLLISPALKPFSARLKTFAVQSSIEGSAAERTLKLLYPSESESVIWLLWANKKTQMKTGGPFWSAGFFIDPSLVTCQGFVESEALGSYIRPIQGRERATLPRSAFPNEPLWAEISRQYISISQVRGVNVYRSLLL